MSKFVAGDSMLVKEFASYLLLLQTIGSTTCPDADIKLSKIFNSPKASKERVDCNDPVQFKFILLANIKWHPGRSMALEELIH